MRLMTAPLLLDALLYAPRGAPAHVLPQALGRALARQLRAARRAACDHSGPSGLGVAGSGPSAAPRQAASGHSGREGGPGSDAGLGPPEGGEERGGQQGVGSGVGRLAVRALHFAPAALEHPITLLQPLPGAEPEVSALLHSRITLRMPVCCAAAHLSQVACDVPSDLSTTHACAFDGMTTIWRPRCRSPPRTCGSHTVSHMPRPCNAG